MENQQIEEMAKIAKAHHDLLMSKPNVVGYDVGYKFDNGVRTDEVCIRVFVREKKDVPAADAVPETLDGVEVDVIERRIQLITSEAPAPSPPDAGPDADKKLYNPAVGGCSIGLCDSNSGGTLGAMMKSNIPLVTQPLLLSNYHVLSEGPGNLVTQPATIDGGFCFPGMGLIGPILDGGIGETVDCASVISVFREAEPSILEIGDVTGTADARLGSQVRKRGRTTYLTEGEVDGLYGTYVELGVMLTNQISIYSGDNKFCDKGDSGSVVVNENDNNVVGLLWAMTDGPSGYGGLANHIDNVEVNLDAQILTESNQRVITRLDYTSLLGPSLAYKRDVLSMAWVQNNGLLAFAYSYDGQTFSWPPVEPGVATEYAPAVCNLFSTFVAAFTNLGDNLLYTYTSPDGIEWSGAWPVNKKSYSAPALAVFNSTLYMAYQGEDGTIRLVKSADGVSWGDEVKIGIATTNTGPALVQYINKLFLAYAEPPDGTLCIISSTNGVDFGNKITLDEKTGTRPALCYFQRRCYLYWEGISSHSLYSRTSSNLGATWENRFESEQTSRGGPTATVFEAKNTQSLGWTGTHDDHTLYVIT